MYIAKPFSIIYTNFESSLFQIRMCIDDTTSHLNLDKDCNQLSVVAYICINLIKALSN